MFGLYKITKGPFPMIRAVCHLVRKRSNPALDVLKGLTQMLIFFYVFCKIFQMDFDFLKGLLKVFSLGSVG